MPEGIEITVDVIIVAAGFLLSAGFKYIPGLQVKFAVMTSQWKSLINALCLALIVGAIILLSCTGLWGLIPCTQPGVMRVIWMMILALMGNTISYVHVPEPQIVSIAKASRSNPGENLG